MVPTRLYTGTTGVQPDPAKTDRHARPSELRSRTATPPFDADPRGRDSPKGKSGEWVDPMGPVTGAGSFPGDRGDRNRKGPPTEETARLPFAGGRPNPRPAPGRQS